jgi:hypothetical protein
MLRVKYSGYYAIYIKVGRLKCRRRYKSGFVAGAKPDSGMLLTQGPESV